MQEDKELLTVEELATFLNCSQGLIHKLKNSNKLPFLKVGSSVRFEKTAVMDFLKKETQEVIFKGA